MNLDENEELQLMNNIIFLFVLLFTTVIVNT